MGWRNQSKTWEQINKVKQMIGKTIVIFDTETTGLKSDAKIIQFAASKYLVHDHSLSHVEDFNVYLNPEESLSDKIVEITGITDQLLEDCPTEKEMAFPILSFLDADILCGYNLPFDIKKVAGMAERCGIYWSEYEYMTFDLLPASRDVFASDEVEDYKLASIVNWIKPMNDIQFHSAIEDVDATTIILNYLLYEAKEPQQSPKRELHLEHAFFNINPRKASQKRLKLVLNMGETGDIFWDCVGKTWSCKKTKAAEKLFAEADMPSLEQQIFRKYSWLYGYAKDMDTLAKNWEKAHREKNKTNG